MYRGGLHHGAAGGGEPAETRGEGQPADGAACRAALADALKGPQALLQFLYIHSAGKSPQPLSVQVVARFQEPLRRTVQYNAHIQELLARNTGHHADNGLLK